MDSLGPLPRGSRGALSGCTHSLPSCTLDTELPVAGTEIKDPEGKGQMLGFEKPRGLPQDLCSTESKKKKELDEMRSIPRRAETLELSERGQNVWLTGRRRGRSIFAGQEVHGEVFQDESVALGLSEARHPRQAERKKQSGPEKKQDNIGSRYRAKHCGFTESCQRIRSNGSAHVFFSCYLLAVKFWKVLCAVSVGAREWDSGASPLRAIKGRMVASGRTEVWIFFFPFLSSSKLLQCTQFTEHVRAPGTKTVFVQMFFCVFFSF